MKLLNTSELEIKKSKFIAYLLPNTAGKSDDKEPSGTSANPIFFHLERQNLTNRAIFVVRYFGGTKLGAGGLSRAYGIVSKNVLND